MIERETIDDAAFGPMNESPGDGWATTFADGRFDAWGRAIAWSRAVRIVVPGSRTPPDDAQRAAWRALVADLTRAEAAVLAALLPCYAAFREHRIEANDPPDVAKFPPAVAPLGGMRVATLSDVRVHRAWAGRPVAIGVEFDWDNEHGVGVLWRDGTIEQVGDSHPAHVE